MKRFGFCAFAGRPNAGKSSLLNRLLGEKLAIVSDKPQTTRHRILGILSDGGGQIVFVDTPGLHRPLHRLNRAMLREARAAWEESDLVCLVRDVSIPFGKGEAYVLDVLRDIGTESIVALNKIDLVRDKTQLLVEIDRYAKALRPRAVVPVSAATGDGCERLLAEIWHGLPEGEPRFPEELLTPHSERFLAAEAIREKILERARAELPFATMVRVESWQEKDGLLLLGAVILVEKASQRRILLGKAGRMIRSIGEAARKELEEVLDRRIFLQLHVLVEADWRERPEILRDLEAEGAPRSVETPRDRELDGSLGSEGIGGGG